MNEIVAIDEAEVEGFELGGLWTVFPAGTAGPAKELPFQLPEASSAALRAAIEYGSPDHWVTAV